MAATILHADDSLAIRRWVAEHLNDTSIKVVSVADGQAALEALTKTPFDLLLTDLEMPVLDGFGLVAAVRELPMYRFLPVLVFSSKKPSDIPPEQRLQVTGWIVKPADPEQLRRWVRRSLPR
ncbi:MAG TPA: response regulator [Isosphaeraceae bacterium]|jgi:two-component system chemotaxis response regulator CheY|nr:response regulator [Isosphaeraceae bacterium]